MPRLHGKISHISLYKFCFDLFRKLGVGEDDAKVIASHLVTANLRGVDSHGAFVRIPHYVAAVREGSINLKPRVELVKDSPSMALLDGDRGFGLVIAMKATDLAISRAKKYGTCIVGVKNISHVGMLAYYTLKMVQDKVVGLAATNSAACVVPWGGSKPVLGTNPFSIGFPVDGDLSIILDMATSVVAAGKIVVYASKGERMPEGWALDKFGKTTTDPQAYLDGGMLLPFGGYKGYGLCLSVDILAGILTGSPNSLGVPGGWAAQGGFIAQAVDVSFLRPYEEYRSEMIELIRLIKSCPPAEGFKEVLLPGEIESRTYRIRLEEGIPVYEEPWSRLSEVGRDLGVPMPELL
jgi:LDH2 family malate/lactate/ureidoglycolate dehydrogenase